MLYSSHASAHDSVLAVGGLQPSEYRVLAIPNGLNRGRFAGVIRESGRIFGVCATSD